MSQLWTVRNIDEDFNPSTSINASPPKREFSPQKYCHWVSSSPRQSALIDSTLNFLGKSSGSNSPTTSRRGKCLKRKLVDESTQLPPLCAQGVVEFVTDESPALSNVCVEKEESVLPKEDASSSREKQSVGAEEIQKKFEASVWTRPSKRLVWKKVELDESTKKMYEEVGIVCENAGRQLQDESSTVLFYPISKIIN